MFKIKGFDKYLNAPMFFFFLLFGVLNCTKEDLPENEEEQLVTKEDTLKNYAPEIRFAVTGRMLEGKQITCIEPDYKGNTWIASGKELYHQKGSVIKPYTLDFPVFDISIAGDETLWIGTDGGGLGHLTEEGITWYNKANSGLPRDYIRNVEVGRDGRIWFSSAAHDLGGLMVFDDNKFKLFTPDNSELNQHVIDDIGIDHDGAVYLITLSTVGKTNIYRITGDSWECLGNPNGTFYWATAFTVGPSGIIFLLEDFMLSSSYHEHNNLFMYKDDEWKKLEPDFMSRRFTFFTAMESDRRNYCWLCNIEGNSYILYVYDGKSWQMAPNGLFQNDKITTIKADCDNNLWIGTSQNGVFILKQ